MDRAMRREELHGLVDGKRQHVADRLALPEHRERLRIEAGATACLAGDLHVGQKAHLYRLYALSLAFGTAAARRIEREAARGVATHARFGGFRVQPADRIPETDVGGRT